MKNSELLAIDDTYNINDCNSEGMINDEEIL